MTIPANVSAAALRDEAGVGRKRGPNPEGEGAAAARDPGARADEDNSEVETLETICTYFRVWVLGFRV